MIETRRVTSDPPRVFAESQVRPLRLVVAVARPTSVRTFRRIVQSLCAKWGGSTSLIVGLEPDMSLSPTGAGAMRAFDPDLVYLYGARSYRQLEQLRKVLDRIGTTPVWVVRYNDRLAGELGWVPTATSEAGIDGRITFADRLHGATATEVAVIGLSAPPADAPPPRTTVRAVRAAASAEPYIAGTPAEVAAGRPTHSVAPRATFLYHRTDDVAAAMTLWNVRATRGLAGHGADVELGNFLSRMSAPRVLRAEIVAADPLTTTAEALVAPHATRVRVVPLSRYRWPRRPNRTPRVGRQSENDDIPLLDGRFELPLRRPDYAIPGGVAGREPSGVYAVELDLQTADDDDRRFGLPASSRLRNLLISFRWNERPTDQERRLTVRSRVARDGSSVLVVRPRRVARAVNLSVPSATDVLNRLSEGRVRFELSDKGRYGQWLTNHLSGLEEVHATLTDARSRVLIALFQVDPRGNPITGSYRRSLTIADMRRGFTEARRTGDLPRRVPGGWTDEEWLRAWVGRFVDQGVLQLGLRVKCVECLADSLIRVGEFGLTYNCPRCGLATRTPAVPEMAYQLNEAAYQFLHFRSDVTALALAAIRRRSLLSFTFTFDHIVRWPNNTINEFDFAAAADGRLFIGESKTGARFTQDDLATLVRVTKQLRPAAVFLASDRECEGGCTLNCTRRAPLYWASRDDSLPRGTTASPGPRERVEETRRQLDRYGTRLVALCRGDLYAPYDRSRRRIILT